MLHANQDLDDETWAALRIHVNEWEAIELVMLAGHYEMLATVITALRIQPDTRRKDIRRRSSEVAGDVRDRPGQDLPPAAT